MSRTARSPDFLALQRRQLDAKLRSGADWRLIDQPTDGWIKAIRTALGMSAAQLAKRLGISPQGVAGLERREAEGDVTIATLRKAADALNCTLVVVLAAKPSLEETVRQQAMAKAQQERNALVHSMRLEDQERGVAESLDLRTSADAWQTQRLAQLWD